MAEPVPCRTSLNPQLVMWIAFECDHYEMVTPEIGRPR